MNIDLEQVKIASWEGLKGLWCSISIFLRSLPEEEIYKIPLISDVPNLKNIAEMYGICDSVLIGNYYINVYFISGYLFRGEKQLLLSDK